MKKLRIHIVSMLEGSKGILWITYYKNSFLKIICKIWNCCIWKFKNISLLQWYVVEHNYHEKARQKVNFCRYYLYLSNENSCTWGFQYTVWWVRVVFQGGIFIPHKNKKISNPLNKWLLLLIGYLWYFCNYYAYFAHMNDSLK